MRNHLIFLLIFILVYTAFADNKSKVEMYKELVAKYHETSANDSKMTPKMKEGRLSTEDLANRAVRLENTSNATEDSFWEQTNVASDGAILTLTVNSSDHIFEGTSERGILRSTDNGESWVKINNGLTDMNVQSLAVNSIGNIFAGTYEEGVFRSTDNGESWTQVNNGLTYLNIYSLAISSSGDIFAGTYGGGAFRSTDSGENWIQVNTGLTGTSVTSLAINSSNDIFAGTNDAGVFRSTDNGSSWVQSNNGLTSSGIFSLAINLGDDIFVSTDYPGGVFRSTDHGENWISTGLSAINTLAINSNDVVFAGGWFNDYNVVLGVIYHSTDNGENWIETSWLEAIVGYQNYANIFTLAINSIDEVYAGNSLGGVYRSTNYGESWDGVNNVMENPYVYSLAINPSNHVFTGNSGGLYRTTDNGNNWTLVNGGCDRSIDYFNPLAVNSSGYIYAGYSVNIPGAIVCGINRSTDNGETWTTVYAGGYYSEVRSLTINSNDNIFIGLNIETLTYSGLVCRSTDDGISWVEIANGLSSNNIQSLAINSNNDVFVGTGDRGVLRSTDNGDSWTQINNGMTSTYVSSLAINSSDVIFAVAGEVFRSTNNGESWTKVNNELTGNSIQTLAINSSDYVFAGTNNGVYHSTNNGDNWMQINDGLTYTSITSLAFNSDGYAFVGTYDGGVYRSTQTTDANTNILAGAGWNLVSVPRLQTNYNADVIFPGKNGSMYSYNTASCNYDAMTILSNGPGYWINYSAPASIFITGPAAVSVTQIAQQAGWVLLGSRETAVAISSLVLDNGAVINGNAYRYNPSTGMYDATTVINPGEGVWINVSKACTITVP